MQTAAGYVLHAGRCIGDLRVGDVVTASIDVERRDLILPNHTFTHVLNYALREVGHCSSHACCCRRLAIHLLFPAGHEALVL